MEWEHLFREIILERGYEYYLEGAVVNEHISKNSISATVSGNDDYDVEIIFNNDKIIGMYCSCPYAADGHNCKHMAAVLYTFKIKLFIIIYIINKTNDSVFFFNFKIVFTMFKCIIY